MNIKLKNWFVSAAVTAALSLAALVNAQETNLPAAPTNLDASVLTNNTTAAVTNADEASSTTDTADHTTAHRHNHHGKLPEIVLFGHDAEVRAGEDVDTVVVIGGSAKVHGRVHDSCVVIGGTLEVDGEVDNDDVVILGNLKVGKNAHLHGDAVAVMGDITMGQGAQIGHDAVSVGGKLELAEGATVGGSKTNIELPFSPGILQGIGPWLRYCVFELRPLAPQVGWIWIVAAAYFLVYLLITILFPTPVQACVDSLKQRPATTFLIGLLSKLFIPVVMLIVAMTGIGLIIVPFLGVALFFGALVGKVALLQWLGLRLGGDFSKGKPVIAFVIGSLLITLLYMIPILGFLTYTLLSLWGLGCAMTAAFARLRREKPPTAQPPQAQTNPPGFGAMAATQTMGTPAGVLTSPLVAAGAAGATGPAHSTSGVPPMPVPIIASVSLPRAGFWERMGAGFLDFIIVLILASMVRRGDFAYFFLIALAYSAGMWAWKGTTVGGIVLKLQVVREDGQPLTFLVALVRALAAAFSIAVLFLGFFWIGWDFDKQGWHDKIAGTLVVRHARSIPLVVV